jgi:CDP-glucose 4,6-dehydratase
MEFRASLLEGVVTMKFWNGKKVLVTGHTGFKGGWLCLWLQKLGAEVIGFALEPSMESNLFKVAHVEKDIISIIGDIRDRDKIHNTITSYKPEIVFHLAAQPLVRKSYENPIETFETNVMGTVNLLDAIRFSNSVKVVINVTSDKCYDNKEWPWGYRETDPMGGYDPYSCSKGCSELITNSFRNSYFQERNVQVASARAGNVIGGGDWAEDRLVPDIVKSLIKGQQPELRDPFAIRPWQHVLEPLSGYMMLAEAMWKHSGEYSEPWNFGPNDDQIITVGKLTDKLITLWGENLNFDYLKSDKLHESKLLRLDCSKAKHRLGWNQKLNLNETLLWTLNWYKTFFNNSSILRDFTLEQIENYEKLGGN